MSPPPLEAARLPLWLLSDEEGIVRACCPGGEHWLEREPEGRTLAELFGEELARRLLSGPEEVFDWARPASIEGARPVPWRLERHRLASGGLLVRAGALSEEAEEVPAAWERRITRRPQDARGDLIEEQRAFMLAILDACPALVFVKDRRGRFIFVNKALADSYGTTPDEMVLAYNAQLNRNEEELKVFSAVDQQVLTTQRPVQLEERVTLRHGARAWYDTHKQPLRAPSGELFVLGISVDITERHRIEQLLQDAKRRLELAVSAGRLGLWDWDVDMGSVYLSPAWKALLGYEDDELPNTFTTLANRLHPEEKERVLEALGRFVRDAVAGERHVAEFRMQAKDGGWRWIVSYAAVVRDARGVGVRVTGFHADITARKEREAAQEQLREKLRRTNEHLERLGRMKDEFLANMSHELRTPLHAVLGQAEAMSEGIFGPLTEEQRDSLRTIEESGRHLLSLINDVLDISKGNAGRLELELSSVPVDEVCQESLRLVREQARRKGVSVSYTREAAEERLWADRRRLRQVLINLLNNARKFTPEGGRIGLKVSSRQQGAELAFTVWDTGGGIAREDHQRIFEPFVQLDAGLARRHEGSGLGLALVRRLAELHGGRVELESEVGEGSRFTVVLPVAPPDAGEGASG